MENKPNNVKLDYDVEKCEFRSLWEERTVMVGELLDLTKKDFTSDIEDLIKNLKENSEDIAKSIFTVFKQDSEIKVPNHKEYYYSLVRKSHPMRGIPLNTDEDIWMRNYMSIALFQRILKDNLIYLKDYFKYVHENDIVGQNMSWDSLLQNIKSITGFLKSMGNEWDVIALDEKLESYLRNIQKIVVVIDPEVLIELVQIAKEIADLLFAGMIKWQES